MSGLLIVSTYSPALQSVRVDLSGLTLPSGVDKHLSSLRGEYSLFPQRTGFTDGLAHLNPAGQSEQVAYPVSEYVVPTHAVTVRVPSHELPAGHALQVVVSLTW
jgi:hypothetical protein